jgi:hypothetical protein
MSVPQLKQDEADGTEDGGQGDHCGGSRHQPNGDRADEDQDDDGQTWVGRAYSDWAQRGNLLGCR